MQEWLAEREADAWDREIERDAASGKLDKLFEKSLADHRAGKSREILRHFTSPDFWERFSRLPAEIQRGGP